MFGIQKMCPLVGSSQEQQSQQRLRQRRQQQRSMADGAIALLRVRHEEEKANEDEE